MIANLEKILCVSELETIQKILKKKKIRPL
jgi:hypothetical protein